MFFKANEDEHDNIDKAVEILKMGGVVLHATTSPWGWALSCDATNEVAIQKIIALKSIILPFDRMVIVQDEKMVEDYITHIPHFVRQFLHSQNEYIAVIYPEANHIAPSACNRDGSALVRVIPSVDAQPVQMSRHVIRLLGKPVFVTPCNIGEGPIPPVYEEIEDLIKKGVDLISPLMFGIDDTGSFSTVIKYDHDGHITIVRKPGE